MLVNLPGRLKQQRKLAAGSSRPEQGSTDTQQPYLCAGLQLAIEESADNSQNLFPVHRGSSEGHLAGQRPKVAVAQLETNRPSQQVRFI
jgi:hypothetical protein